MKINQIFLLLAFLPLIFSANAEVKIKLNCRMSIEATDNLGGKERANRDILVEIDEVNYNTYIITNDDMVGSVSTSKRENVISIDNFSDSNKWDITRKVRTNSGGILTNHTIIDRNTGKISYFSELQNTITVYANGNCVKVDTNKKLF